MSLKLGLCISTLCVFGLGCSPIGGTVITLIIEPAHFRIRSENRAEKERNQALAKTEWETYLASCPDNQFSKSYEHGFKEGFADYLYAGESGNLPPLPPRSYRGAKYDTPEGRNAIADWLEGFRRGSAAAQSSGYGDLVIVPPSTALPTRRIPELTSPSSESGNVDWPPAPKKVGPVSPLPLPQPENYEFNLKSKVDLPGPRLSNSSKAILVRFPLVLLAGAAPPKTESATNEDI